MKIRPSFIRMGEDFQAAKSLPINFQDALRLPERTTTIDCSVGVPLQSCQLDFLFDYSVFPSTILQYKTEWAAEKRSLRLGDIVLQRVFLAPIGMGLCLDFATRICAIYNEHNRQGFAYETLLGHAERGVSEFYFEQRGDHLYFTIHTYSEPANWAMRTLFGWLMLRYQAWCTWQAAKRVRQQFVEHNATQ